MLRNVSDVDVSCVHEHFLSFIAHFLLDAFSVTSAELSRLEARFESLAPSMGAKEGNFGQMKITAESMLSLPEFAFNPSVELLLRVRHVDAFRPAFICSQSICERSASFQTTSTLHSRSSSQQWRYCIPLFRRQCERKVNPLVLQNSSFALRS